MVEGELHFSSSLIIAYAAAFISSLGLTLFLVPVARTVALRLEIVDLPGARKIHQHPKPYLGGVAIYLSFTSIVFGGIFCVWLWHEAEFFKSNFPWIALQGDGIRSSFPRLVAILTGATLAFLIGLWDDIWDSPRNFYLKVGVQFSAAILAVLSGVSIDFFGTPLLNVPISILWIVGIMNAFNLLDNMDGLSSGIAAIALLIFTAVAIMLGQHYVALINLALMGSVLGFLRYNFYPSKIFMGDAGSLFIGYLMGTLTVLESYVDGDGLTVFSLVMPLLILSVPLADTASVIIIRLKNGKPIYVGDRNHLSHRLVSMGFSHRGAVIMLYSIGLLLGMTALLLPELSLAQGGLLVLQALLLVCVLSALIFYGNKGRMRPGEIPSALESRESTGRSTTEARVVVNVQ